jgi:hypothetical protein
MFGKFSLTSNGHYVLVPFMSAAVATPTTQPDPATADQPSPSARLICLVRKLIDYGRQLAASFQQRTINTEVAGATSAFGTKDIAQILARITRGLLRATALEASLVRGTACLDTPTRQPAASTQRRPRCGQDSNRVNAVGWSASPSNPATPIASPKAAITIARPNSQRSRVSAVTASSENPKPE